MLRAIFTRANATRLVVVLALALGLTGGAYAAGVIEITSIKQISPKVVEQLRHRPGPAGAIGVAGPRGEVGPAGQQGAEGATGLPGADGTSVTLREIQFHAPECFGQGGKEVITVSGHTTICNGRPGNAPPPKWPKSLPKGATETGVWSFGPAEPGFFVVAVASFPIELEAALDREHVHLIDELGEELHSESPPAVPTQCGEPVGTVEEPRAASGNLCIFVASRKNAEIFSENIFGLLGEVGAAKVGATMLVVAKGLAEGHGSWAVTG